jgi:hypothetical protein
MIHGFIVRLTYGLSMRLMYGSMREICNALNGLKKLHAFVAFEVSERDSSGTQGEGERR